MSASNSISPEVQRVVDTVMQHENVPRKRAKFTNFVKNILRGTRPAAIDATWDIFEQALKKKPEEEKPKQEEKEVKKEEDKVTNGKEATGQE